MATSSTNKNSLYVGSLTSYILDTKPYHSKLTEIQEIYQFSDSMNVKIDEAMFSLTLDKAAWMYQYFSGGQPLTAGGVGQPMQLHQLTDPLVRPNSVNDETSFSNRGAFKAFRDENTDLPLVPFAFDPTCLGGVGLADAFAQRGGVSTLVEPMLEGLDFFLSKGAYVFQIKQTVSSQPIVVGYFDQSYTAADAPFPIAVALPFTNADSLLIIGPAVQVTLSSISVTGPGQVKVTGLSADPNYSPTYTERSNENLLGVASAVTQQNALDTANPNSAVMRIRAIMALIGAQLTAHPNATASTQLALLNTTLAIPQLPASYEALLNALVAGGTPVLTGYTGWQGQDITPPYTDLYVDQVLASYSPSLYFNMYSDINQREGGALAYANLTQDVLTVSDIAANPIRADYEEWTLLAVNATNLLVTGSKSGSIGSATVGSTFTSAALGFTLTATGPMTVGTTYLLTPSSKITVHYQAPLEAWSLIKTNPHAYTRPVFGSTRYGYVMSQAAVPNFVTILDEALPTGTYTLTATSSTSFTLTSSADSLYTATIAVNTVFNDGHLAFTIVTGSAYTFQVGDKFFIEIVNEPAMAQDLDLYYGYDMGPYDADTIVYNTISSAAANYLEAIGFGYDSRFVGYDLTSFGLQLTQNAVDGRSFRLRALPNLSMPLPLQNSTPTNQVNLLADNDPLNPNATSQFDMTDNQTSEGPQSATDPDLVTDLQLWYATDFAFEYLDPSTNVWVMIDTVPIGTAYVNATQGVSFTIVNAAAPFIAAQLNSSSLSLTSVMTTETVFGGDTIFWSIQNPDPLQTEPASLTGRLVPRLIMYSESYWNTAPAAWTVQFIAPGEYTLNGVYTTGQLAGQVVFGTAVTVNTATNGQSYKNDALGLHFTVVNGSAGLAPTDRFTWTTFQPSPSYLVHGSVSGWQPDATVGEFYWNGKIGFKIPASKASLFDGGVLVETDSPWTTANGTVTLNYLRPDAPSVVYTAISYVAGHWTLIRDGKVVADGATRLIDQYIDLTLPTPSFGWKYTIQVLGHGYHLSMGNDLAIVRTTAGRMPTANDFVLLERTKDDALQISIVPIDAAHAITLSQLAPVTIDLRYVDLNANSGVPLSATSPETAVLQGWLPILETRLNSSSFLANFSDTANTVVIRAAATGETIGTVEPVSTDPTNVIFRWDPTFHGKYLPLNAQATVVTLGQGMDEQVHVAMRDSAMFLLSGGGLTDSMLFTDTASVTVSEDLQWTILNTYAESAGITIAEGPFSGFLPGYDNTQYDFELGTGDVNDDTNPAGSYDAGVPLTDYFMQAQGLAGLPSLTPQQQALQNDLLSLLDPYLDPAGILATTLAEFLASIEASGAVNWTPTYYGFGIPAVGMGMEITDDQGEASSTSIIESLTITDRSFGYAFDDGGFDAGGMDELPDSTVILISQNLPPVPSTGLPPPGTLYANFDSPLVVPAPGARVIEVSFTQAVVSTPQFYAFRPTDVAPLVIPIVERLSAYAFRFSLPSASELKLIVA